jgi:hypothetical protein
MADKDMLFDVIINATLKISADDWNALVSECDGDEYQAQTELIQDLEGGDIDTTIGDAWVCYADVQPM